MTYESFRLAHFDWLMRNKKEMEYKIHFHTFIANLATMVSVFEGDMDAPFFGDSYRKVLIGLPLLTESKVIINMEKYVKQFDFTKGLQSDTDQNAASITCIKDDGDVKLYEIIVKKELFL